MSSAAVNIVPNAKALSSFHEPGQLVVRAPGQRNQISGFVVDQLEPIRLQYIPPEQRPDPGLQRLNKE